MTPRELKSDLGLRSLPSGTSSRTLSLDPGELQITTFDRLFAAKKGERREVSW